jgi:hypothetical protein
LKPLLHLALAVFLAFGMAGGVPLVWPEAMATAPTATWPAISAMKRLHIILATLALAAIAVVGYSQTKAQARPAKANACCDGGACCR